MTFYYLKTEEGLPLLEVAVLKDYIVKVVPYMQNIENYITHSTNSNASWALEAIICIDEYILALLSHEPDLDIKDTVYQGMSEAATELGLVLSYTPL